MKRRSFFCNLVLGMILCVFPAYAQDAPAEAVQAPVSLDARMTEFFDGLIASVRANEGNCEAMVESLKVYCQNKREWIVSLDYATTNVNEQTIAAVREKSVDLGKLLSQCYDEKSALVIPQLLESCANPQ